MRGMPKRYRRVTVSQVYLMLAAIFGSLSLVFHNGGVSALAIMALFIAVMYGLLRMTESLEITDDTLRRTSFGKLVELRRSEIAGCVFKTFHSFGARNFHFCCLDIHDREFNRIEILLYAYGLGKIRQLQNDIESWFAGTQYENSEAIERFTKKYPSK